MTLKSTAQLCAALADEESEVKGPWLIKINVVSTTSTKRDNVSDRSLFSLSCWWAEWLLWSQANTENAMMINYRNYLCRTPCQKSAEKFLAQRGVMDRANLDYSFNVSELHDRWELKIHFTSFSCRDVIEYRRVFADYFTAAFPGDRLLRLTFQKTQKVFTYRWLHLNTWFHQFTEFSISVSLDCVNEQGKW